MGARGPQKQPSIIRYIRGNPSKEKLPDDEPTPDLLPIDTPAPEWLSEQEKSEWSFIVPILQRMRVFTEADEIAVALIATYLAEIKECREMVTRFGKDTLFFGPDPNNPGKQRIKHSQPTSWYTRMQICRRELLRLCREFGLTASSRSSISTNASQSTNELSALLDRRSKRTRA